MKLNPQSSLRLEFAHYLLSRSTCQLRLLARLLLQGSLLGAGALYAVNMINGQLLLKHIGTAQTIPALMEQLEAAVQSYPPSRTARMLRDGIVQQLCQLPNIKCDFTPQKN